uniref:Uncharacterized protein n=1 Tax=Minutocellus polymorphus TaxID=265543 RepID=A0A7S0FLU5_9STRA|mmetsp:Transcript_17216/g.28672  ORF Transcript_17216/g.28672 Transcript_17216/m.28672 type:complete len:168 (+) Transcript_17216:98-601(+)
MKVFAVLGALLFAASCNGQQYECRTGRSCRCSSSNRCEHTSYYGLTLNNCREKCDNEDDDCKGYEWTNNGNDSDDENHCEIHEVLGNRYNDVSQDRSDTVCCWRVSANPTPRPPTPRPPTPRPTPAPTNPKDNKGGKRQRDRVRNFLRNLRFEDDKEDIKAGDNSFF